MARSSRTMSPLRAYARSPATFRARANSAQPRFSSSSTWYLTSKPKAGRSPHTLIVALADSPPTGDPVQGIVGVSSSSSRNRSLTPPSCSRTLFRCWSCSSCSAFSLVLVSSSAFANSLANAFRLVELTLKFAAGLVQAEQFVHVQVDALDPDGRLYGFRVIPDESSVQHGGN